MKKYKADANIQWLETYIINRIRGTPLGPLYFSIPNEIEYLVSHIDIWVSTDPEENVRAVRHKLALLLFLESQRSEEMDRDDFIVFIRCIIDSLRGEKVFGMCIGVKIERKLEDFFKGFEIEKGELFTPVIKDYLKRLDARYISKNKKITEFMGLEV